MNTSQHQTKGTSIPEMAANYQVSESLLYSLANQNQLPGCRRLGRRFVIHRPTFEQWLAEGLGS
mgnify:CR=1 FL=1|jgi:predicted DNA-binding transcriptional regulator AlpA